MKPKTYRTWRNNAKKLFCVSYQVNKTTNKEIQFSFVEQYLQFVDLLLEANYAKSEY